MARGFAVNYWHWAFTAGIMLLLLAAFPVYFADVPFFIVELVVSYFVAGYAYRWVKKTFFKPIMLFDLHNVLVAGDIEVEDLYELPGTRDFIRRLRMRYFTAAFTNFSPELVRFYGKKFGWFGEFDAFFYSGRYGIRKPDARVFGEVLRSLGVRPGDVIFFDDREENVIAAQKLGFKTVLFTNASEAERQLNKMGIRTR